MITPARHLVVALSALWLVAGAAAQQALDLSTSMTNDEVGMTIYYPPSWGVATYPGLNQIEFYDGPTLFIVDAFPVDMIPYDSLDELLDFAAADIEAQLADVSLSPFEAGQVGGLDTLGIAYVGSDEGMRVRGGLLVMADDTYAYLIYFDTLEERYAELEPTFMAMLARFELHRD